MDERAASGDILQPPVFDDPHAMSATSPISPQRQGPSTPPRGHDVACVSYFNARPLIEGLDCCDHVRLSFDVPSRLIDRLASATADVALLPVIDLHLLPGLRVLPVGAIGCDGETLTVRIFSRVPPGQIRRLACDVESHTSVALAGVVLRELYRTDVELIPMDRTDLYHSVQGGSASLPARDPDGVLLIGDKVVTSPPSGYSHQLDLGEAWKRLTGLPFVFAAWTLREGVEAADLPLTLLRARQLGLSRVVELARRYAVPCGWPQDLACKYLTDYLRFDFGPRQLQAVSLFRQLAGHPDSPVRLAVG